MAGNRWWARCWGSAPLLMCIAVVSFSALVACIKALSQRIPLFELVFARAPATLSDVN